MERCSARLTPCGQLPRSPSCDEMVIFLLPPLPSKRMMREKDIHLRERPSPALNKTLHCLSAVLLSHLCSSAQYFRFLLLCWFCFLTQTSRLKNRPVVTSHRVVDLLRQRGSFRAARKQMKPTPFYISSLKETF